MVLREVRHNSRSFRWFFAVVSFFYLAGCQLMPDSQVNTSQQRVGLDTVLVVPFESIDRQEFNTIGRCPVCNAVLNPGQIEPGADSFMTKELLAVLKTETTYTLFGPGIAEGVRSEIISEDIGISQRRLLVEMGRRVGADAVISGIVYRFRQRIGTTLSVDSPASVGFGIHLLRTSDGRLIWGRHFDETQRSLSEDLFKLGAFVKRGGGWLTVENLAVYGLKELMASLPIHN